MGAYETNQDRRGKFYRLPEVPEKSRPAKHRAKRSRYLMRISQNHWIYIFSKVTIVKNEFVSRNQVNANASFSRELLQGADDYWIDILAVSRENLVIVASHHVNRSIFEKQIL